MCRRVIHTGRRTDAHKRKPIRGADNDALLVFLGLVLDQRADRHNEESAEEA